MTNQKPVLTGKCYCGAIEFRATQQPQTVVYCHCNDCRRATGGPVSVFVAMDEAAVSFSPNEGRKVSVVDGATRTFCPDCGSSLTGRYAYLPDQVYISLGVIDQAGELVPELHVHEDSRLSWLHIQDDLERMAKSGRAKIGSI